LNHQFRSNDTFKNAIERERNEKLEGLKMIDHKKFSPSRGERDDGLKGALNQQKHTVKA